MKDLKIMNSDTFRYKPLNGFLSEYFNKTHVNYNYNLSGNSISSIVYKIDLENSTVSEGSETVLQKVGPESPYRYLRISNVPIFNVQQVELTTEWSEDHGYMTETRIECIANPNIVSIEVDDYIILEYSSYKNLYRVISASPDTFEQINYNKLTLLATQYTNENIDYQVSKRFSYVFETASVIDESTNNILNDLLSQINNFYKIFLAEFYAPHGIIIERSLLLKLDKYFKFDDLNNNIKIYSYFFKKYISQSLITSKINVSDTLSIYFKKNNIEEVISDISEDEAKFLVYFIDSLESGNNIYDTVVNALKIISEERKNLLKTNPKYAIDSFSSPYQDFFDVYQEFYTIYKETAKIIIDTSILIDVNNKNNIKFLSNLKKMTNILTSDKSSHKILTSILFLFIVKSIPFKRIDFNKRNMEYGE